MKKLVIFALALVVLVAAFSGCSKTPEQFTGQWKFSRISKVEISPETSESQIDGLKEQYGAEDENGIAAAALNAFAADKTFDPYYVRFEKDRTYTYDPIGEREATWIFYQTGENQGVISFYDMDPAEITPNPAVFPPVIYNAEAKTLSVTVSYSAFFVTVELTR